MFKIVCINKGKPNPNCLFKEISYLVEGEVYTIKNIVTGLNGNYKEIEAYELYEVLGTYATYLFIPLSDIDETEFERNYNTEKIKL